MDFEIPEDAKRNYAAYEALPDDLRCHVRIREIHEFVFHPRLFGDQVDQQLFFRAGNLLRASGFIGTYRHNSKNWSYTCREKRSCRLEKK